MDCAELQSRFQLLARDVPSLRAACEARVVRWARATSSAALHRCEPLHGERHLGWAGALVDWPTPPEDYWRQGTSYGLDGESRFVVARSAFVGTTKPHREALTWRESPVVERDGESASGELAFLAEVHSSELLALVAVELRDGDAVRAWRIDCFGFGFVEERYSYENGRPSLIRSLDINLHIPANRQLQAWRASYDADGDLALLTSALAFVYPGRPDPGGDHVDRGVAGDAPWPSFDAWVEDPRTTWHVVWDARVDRRERELPTIAEALLDGLAEDLADLAITAAEAAIAAGACERPFVLTLMARNDELLPRRARLGDQALRSRALELGLGSEALMRAVDAIGIELDVFEHAGPDTLRRIRQAKQLSEPDRVEWLKSPDWIERDQAFAAFAWRLNVALNRRIPAGATDDFIAFGPWPPDAVREAVGEERFAAFPAAMTPSAVREAARVGRITGAASIERLAKQSGLAAHAQTIAASARWSLELTAAPAGSKARSKLGGRPLLPASEPWPTWQDRPLSFIAELHLRELPTMSEPPAITPPLPLCQRPVRRSPSRNQ